MAVPVIMLRSIPRDISLDKGLSSAIVSVRSGSGVEVVAGTRELSVSGSLLLMGSCEVGKATSLTGGASGVVWAMSELVTGADWEGIGGVATRERVCS